jgi:hypothetical protein
MFFPFYSTITYSTIMLGIESANVIGLRMLKLTFGGLEALNEMHLMMGEKLNAFLEADANLLAGASAEGVIHRYRQHVAENAKRLGCEK